MVLSYYRISFTDDVKNISEAYSMEFRLKCVALRKARKSKRPLRLYHVITTSIDRSEKLIFERTPEDAFKSKSRIGSDRLVQLFLISLFCLCVCCLLVLAGVLAYTEFYGWPIH